MESNTNKIILCLLVVAHFLGNVSHGGAHTELAINLPDYKLGFVIVVILAGPVIGAGLLWTRHAVTGAWLAGVCLLSSFLFSVYHHYVMVSIDHVDHLPAAAPDIHLWFTNSALFIAIAALLGAVYAFYSIRRTD